MVGNPLLFASKLPSIGLEVLSILHAFSSKKPEGSNLQLDVDLQDRHGNTALHYSALLDNLPFMDYLVFNLGADVNQVNYFNEKPIDLC